MSAARIEWENHRAGMIAWLDHSEATMAAYDRECSSAQEFGSWQADTLSELNAKRQELEEVTCDLTNIPGS